MRWKIVEVKIMSQDCRCKAIHSTDCTLLPFHSPPCLKILLLRHGRSEEHTSELQSRLHLVCRLLLEKKNKVTFNSPAPDSTPSRQTSVLGTDFCFPHYSSVDTILHPVSYTIVVCPWGTSCADWSLSG